MTDKVTNLRYIKFSQIFNCKGKSGLLTSAKCIAVRKDSLVTAKDYFSGVEKTDKIESTQIGCIFLNFGFKQPDLSLRTGRIVMVCSDSETHTDTFVAHRNIDTAGNGNQITKIFAINGGSFFTLALSTDTQHTLGEMMSLYISVLSKEELKNPNILGDAQKEFVRNPILKTVFSYSDKEKTYNDLDVSYIKNLGDDNRFYIPINKDNGLKYNKLFFRIFGNSKRLNWLQLDNNNLGEI